MEQNLEIKKFEKELPTLKEHCSQMQVKRIEDVNPVNEIFQEIKTRVKIIKDWINPLIEAANISHKKLTAKRNELLNPYTEIKAILDGKVSQFYAVEKRKREIAQQKIDEIARKKEQKRIDELEAQAKRLEEKGDLKRAEERREKKEEVFIPPTVIPEMETHVKGSSGSLNMIPDIEIEITNEMELAKEAVDGHIPISCMEFKIGKIKSYCKSFKIKDGQIKGIRIKDKFTSRTISNPEVFASLDFD